MKVNSSKAPGFENESVSPEEKEEALDELIKVAESGAIKQGQLSHIRRLIRRVGSEIVLLRELGPEWVERYFKAQQGPHLDNPYFLPNPIAEDQLGAYLDFEFGDEEYRRQCVVDLITQPLNRGMFDNTCDLNLSSNLALSHLRGDIDFFVYINQWVTGDEMAGFLERVKVGIGNDKARKAFSHLFSKKRWQMLFKYAQEIRQGRRIRAQKFLKKIRTEDRAFFERLQVNSILGV